MRYRINSPQVITETIEGEAIMINLGTGNYYSVGGSGAEICSWLEHGASLEAIVDTLARQFDHDRESLAEAVGDLIRDLEREELVVLDSGNGSGPLPESLPTGRTFDPPRLEKYTDMQDLVLLDPVHEVGEQGWPHVQPAPSPDGA
jgi:hypothetical protein